MANVGVTFDFAAESAKLRSEIDKVRKELGTLNDTAKGIGDAFKTLGGIVASAFSVNAIVNAGKAAIEFGDQMQKAAARTGIAADQFALLSGAAKLADVDTQSLSTALRAMQVSVSQAGSGSKAQIEAFSALGVAFADLQRLAPQDQFVLLADRIDKLQDPADRVRAAVELFGKSGANLLPFFDQGAAGIRHATEEITRMGGAITDTQIQRLADADEAIKRLGSSWDSFARTLTAAVAPAITKVFDLLSNADTSKIDAARASQIKALLESRGPVVDFYEDTKALKAELAEIEQRLAAVARQRQLLALSRGNVSDVLADVPPGFAAPAAKVPAAAAAPATQQDQLGLTTSQVGDAFEGIGDASRAISDPTTDYRVVHEQMVGELLVSERAAYNARMLEQQSQFGEGMVGLALLASQGIVDAQAIQTNTTQQNLGVMIGSIVSATSALGKRNKAFAVASIIWNTADAAIQSFKNAGGYPWGIAPAAAMVATGMAQLANVNKTNIGSGGSISHASGGGSAGSTPSAAMPNNVPGATPAKDNYKEVTQVVIQGNIFSSTETAEWLVGQISEAVNNRDMVFISQNSRQAMELAGAGA